MSDGPLGLRMGEDDCLVKPFDPVGMVARANALHQRIYTNGPASINLIDVQDLYG